MTKGPPSYNIWCTVQPVEGVCDDIQGYLFDGDHARDGLLEDAIFDGVVLLSQFAKCWLQCAIFILEP